MTGALWQMNSEDRARADKVLAEARFAYVALVDRDAPYVVPMNFAFEPGEEVLYLHSGVGRRSTALGEDPRVCLAMVSGARFQRGDGLCKDGFMFRSVIVEGRALLLAKPAEKEMGLRALARKYDPAAAHLPFEEAVLERTLVYRVALDAVSYRELPRRQGQRHRKRGDHQRSGQ
jgi:uncharacterized protein